MTWEDRIALAWVGFHHMGRRLVAAVARYGIFIIVRWQIGLSSLSVKQIWSMPVGLGLIIGVCGVSTFFNYRGLGFDRWRVRIITLAFIVWGTGFIVIAIQRVFFDGAEIFSSGTSIARQFLFVAALSPSSRAEDSPLFRSLDAVQGALFALSMGILTWLPLTHMVTAQPDYRYVYVGYAAMAAFAFLSFVAQENRGLRKAIGNIALLLALYGVISAFSIVIDQRFAPADNSPLWAIGDVPFIIYSIAAGRIRRDLTNTTGRSVVKQSPWYLVPILVTLLIFGLSIEIAEFSIWLGIATGSCGFFVYAVRTTVLFHAYNGAQQRTIDAKNAHADFLTDMIHEVRAPLGSIALNATLLNKSNELIEPQSRWIHAINASAERLNTMMNDVLAIERLDADMIRVSLTDQQLAEVVTASIAGVAAMAIEARISISSEIGVDTRVSTDARLLERVFTNLMTNSLRYTLPGGSIAIRARVEGPDTLVVAIADDGVGIARELQTRLFDRFSHLGDPVQGERGAGLGLAICHSIMKALGGEIRLESELGRGTLVELRMPRAP